MFARRLLTPGAAALVAAALVFAACSDNRDRGLITAPGSPASMEAAPDLDTQINSLIDQFYSGGPRTAVRARWENVKRQSMKNLSGRAQHVQLVAWIQSQTAAITPAADETRDHAAARLALLMSLYVYGGPETEPPVISPGSDATLEIVAAGEAETVITPAEAAAVVFPEGATSEPTIMVVAENEEAFPAECSGPLPTTRCQYPLFYKFNAFPNVKLNKAVSVAVCHVNHGSRRTPLADHERFRLAHEKPADPSANHPEGTIEEGIEILPLTSVGELLECEETEDPHEHAALSSERGTFASLVTRARWRAGRVAKAVGKMLTPKSLYAIDRGGGGETMMFSNFNVVDPQSRPDVTPAEGFSIAPTSGTAGTPVTVNAWSIDNVGTAASVQVTAAIVLARDPALTQDAVTLTTLPPVTVVPPRQAVPVLATSVTIPEGTASGAWFLGVRLAQAGAHAESDVSNNVASVAFTVSDPSTVYCPEAGPEGSYRDITQAIAATPTGGTMLVCDGTHSMDNVNVNKAMTIKSLNPAGATFANLLEVPPSQSSPPIFIVDGVESGTVRFEDLNFSLRGRAIQAGSRIADVPGSYDRLEIDNVRFSGAEGVLGGIVITAARTTVPDAKVELTNSAFSRISIGIFIIADVEVNTRHSTFDRIGGGSVTYSNFRGHGVVEENTFSNCGATGCIRLLGSGQVTIRRNRFEARDQQLGAGFGAIHISPFLPPPHEPAIVEDNVIVGVAGDLDDPATWKFPNGIAIAGNSPAINIVRRNQITAAHAGVFIASGSNGGADISDNVIRDGVFGFRQANGTAIARRNDIMGTAGSFSVTGPPSVVADYRCNWWSSTNGPTNPQGNARYAPWAMQPVAGNDSPCDPDVDMTTVRACPTGEPGGAPWTFGTVPQAYNHVAAGGTVLVCDGTHAVSGLRVQKSVTFAAEGPGRPAIDGGGGNESFLLDSPAPTSASVTLRGLKMQNSQFQNVLVRNHYGRLLIDDVEFLPGLGTPNADGLAYFSGVAAFDAAGAEITVQNSRFTGGDIGVHQSNSATVVVKNSTFTNQRNAAIHGGNGGSLRAEGNTINGCGAKWCIGVFNGGTVGLIDNTVTVDMSRPVITALQLHGGTYTLTDNVVTGTGGTRDVNAPQSWPIQNAINLAGNGSGGPGTGTLTGNRVSGAHTGLNLHGGSTGTGTDNVISDVRDAMFFFRSSFVLSRSDISNYHQSIAFVFESPNASAKCNWWGNANGPTPANEHVAPAFYTPFAQQPIAGTTTQCDPDQSFQTVRACPTGGNGGPFTVSTVQQAYGLVEAEGTVLICDGVHVVRNLQIEKPVTIRAEGPGVPILDADANTAFIVRNTGGTVVFRGLEFPVEGGSGMSVDAGNGRVVVEQSVFRMIPTPTSPAGGTGIFVNSYYPNRPATPTTLLEVRASRFVGGFRGVDVGNGAQRVDLIGNTFEHAQSAGFAIGVSPGGRLVANENVFNGCGEQCVGGGENSNVDFDDNRVTVDINAPSGTVVNAGNNGMTLRMNRNIITGVGRNMGHPDPARRYPIREAIMAAPGSSITGSDNHISGVYAPFQARGTITMTRNDIVDYDVAFFGTLPSDFRCNWWGTVDGPRAPADAPASMYDPWAREPIAGKPNVACP